MKPYDHKKIEKKWQKVWDEKKVYQTLSAKKAKANKLKPYYVLDMFPYPSGSGLHVGHPRGYIASDVFARMKRMQGYNVLHPMGYDSFGLPAEQYAIKTGKNPGPFTEQLVKHYRKQLESIGFSFDWNREVATHRPEFYKWTQWIFLQIYNSYYDLVKNRAAPIECLEKEFAVYGNGRINAVCDADTPKFSKKEWNSFSELERQSMLMHYRLAYEGYAEVNWCPELGTVLANDEVIEKNGKLVSERGEFPVEKKQMRQWFMRITAYADRLLSGLETIDWPANIKEIQKNWIGKSEGSEITFYLENKEFGYFVNNIDVFTTRADTLFGVSYVALAVDHPAVESLLKKEITNWDKVYAYIQEVKNQDRANVKEITGIKLEGVVAKQSFMNDFEVPVYLTNYVLGSYGTGAVMGVPAHDERDFEFANKYDLPIKHVVARPAQETPRQNILRRDGVVSIVRNKKGEILVLQKEGGEEYLFPQGGIENNENPLNAAFREVREESGYSDIRFVSELGVHENYFEMKEGTRHRITHTYLFDLVSDENKGLDLDDDEITFVSHWMKPEDVLEKINTRNHKLFFEIYLDSQKQSFIEYGILTNSNQFNNLTSGEAKKAITEFVGGKLVTKYKMRDAIFARQRYWGEPIPLVHEKDGTISELPLKKLPLELPNVKSYEPSGTGEGPLATVKSWVQAGYETNTMPGWAGSSWYFLRYADPNNTKAFASEDELDYWFNKKNGGVDMYVGGAEHATGHLLYSRFWHKVLKDLGHVKTEEPFKALRNQGLIGGTDGRKMSKRYGNVVNPDDVVAQFGADSLRIFEMFLGPFESALPWSTDGIIGPRRFIERVWRLSEKVVAQRKASGEYQKILHKTIKKVTEGIQTFSFNTAISSMMICINELEQAEVIDANDFKKFLQILAPFAPHVAEELWQTLSFGEGRGGDSIHLSSWPTYNPKLVIDNSVKIGIQVNGKVRAEIEIALDATEADVKNMVLQIPEVIKWIDGKEIKKFIFVPKKIISIVV